jgi:hypothetical protein
MEGVQPHKAHLSQFCAILPATLEEASWGRNSDRNVGKTGLSDFGSDIYDRRIDLSQLIISLI